mmetsp:Transcript_2678/g.8027  ORF Transcript_2678/g.8027 Transcript_2678/m.8027 type:complete len:98 (+) Transcript_2678:178-471(+)
MLQNESQSAAGRNTTWTGQVDPKRAWTSPSADETKDASISPRRTPRCNRVVLAHCSHEGRIIAETRICETQSIKVLLDESEHEVPVFAQGVARELQR